MLIPTSGLKRDGWETHLELSGDRLQNGYSGAVLPLTTGPSGLSTLENLFDEEEDAFVCAPCAEVELDECPTFNVDSLPRHTRGALGQHISKMQKMQFQRKRKQRLSKLEKHRRVCHFHDEDAKVERHDCLEYKGKKKGHSKIRKEKYKAPAPLLLFSTDFFGPVEPVSFQGSRWVMVFTCDCCQYAHAAPVARKSDAPVELEKFAKEIRRKCGADIFSGKSSNEKAAMVMGGIRSDNEPTLKSKAWKDVCERYNIDETHSAPYEPQMNGTAERFVQTSRMHCGRRVHMWSRDSGIMQSLT